MQITLIRHTTPDVPAGICYGQSDVPLRASFEEEAEVVRRRLSGMDFDAVYTSPLSRCVRLAHFCGYPDAIQDGRLMEINFGLWEMQRYDHGNVPHTPPASWADAPAVRALSAGYEIGRAHV